MTHYRIRRPAQRNQLISLLALAILGTVTACTSTPATPAPTSGGQVTSVAPSTVPSAIPTEVSPPGDVPDNQAYVEFTSSSGTFTIKVPEGWSRTTTPRGTVFSDKLNSIQVEQSAEPTPPTPSSVRGSKVPALDATMPKFQLTKVTTFTRPGGSGVLVTYLEDSAPNKVTGSVVRDAGELYLFWKNGVTVAVTLTSPQGADNVDPWNVVTRSFRWSK